MTDLHTLAKTRNIYISHSSILFASIPTKVFLAGRPFVLRAQRAGDGPPWRV